LGFSFYPCFVLIATESITRNKSREISPHSKGLGLNEIKDEVK
jgi:hypothetical protein